MALSQSYGFAVFSINSSSYRGWYSRGNKIGQVPINQFQKVVACPFSHSLSESLKSDPIPEIQDNSSFNDSYNNDDNEKNKNKNKKKRKPRPSFNELTLKNWSRQISSERHSFPWQKHPIESSFDDISDEDTLDFNFPNLENKPRSQFDDISDEDTLNFNFPNSEDKPETQLELIGDEDTLNFNFPNSEDKPQSQFDDISDEDTLNFNFPNLENKPQSQLELIGDEDTLNFNFPNSEDKPQSQIELFGDEDTLNFNFPNSEDKPQSQFDDISDEDALNFNFNFPNSEYDKPQPSISISHKETEVDSHHPSKTLLPSKSTRQIQTGDAGKSKTSSNSTSLSKSKPKSSDDSVAELMVSTVVDRNRNSQKPKPKLSATETETLDRDGANYTDDQNQNELHGKSNAELMASTVGNRNRNSQKPKPKPKLSVTETETLSSSMVSSVALPWERDSERDSDTDTHDRNQNSQKPKPKLSATETETLSSSMVSSVALPWERDSERDSGTDTHDRNRNSQKPKPKPSATETETLSISMVRSSVALPWERDSDTDTDNQNRNGLHGKQSNTEMAERTIPELELRRLRDAALRMKERMRVGPAGVTETVVRVIHDKWNKGEEVVKLRFEGAPSLDMKRIHRVLEGKTGGIVIWRSGRSLVLYRGMNYKLPCVKSYATYQNQNKAHGPHGPDESDSSHELSSSERLLDGLGPRYRDWSGRDPVPVDADLLPGLVSGYRPPFRVFPYRIRRSLRDAEMTAIRRLARSTPPHFALGRNREHQGLAAAIVKLWEKSAIAKIAIKRGMPNTSNERMAEEIKKLTGGTVVSRNKEYIVLYRGKDFVTPLVRSTLLDKQRQAAIHQNDEELAREKALESLSSSSDGIPVKAKHYVAGTLEETPPVRSALLDKQRQKALESSSETSDGIIPVKAKRYIAGTPEETPPVRSALLDKQRQKALESLSETSDGILVKGRRYIAGTLEETPPVRSALLDKQRQKAALESLSETSDGIPVKEGRYAAGTLEETPPVRSALLDKQRQKELESLSETSDGIPVKKAKRYIAGTLEETKEAVSKWGKNRVPHLISKEEKEEMRREKAVSKHVSLVRCFERKLHLAKVKFAKAEKALAKVQEALVPTELPTDLETVTDEERSKFRAIGLKMNAFLSLGRREVFDGTIQNIHLNWKHKELVKVIVKRKSFAQVKHIAIDLEAESGGVLISLDKTTKGYAIILYRGKNYERPDILRPKNLLSGRKALARSIELQRREALKHHMLVLQSKIKTMKVQLEQMRRGAYTKENHLLLQENNDTFSSYEDVNEEGEEAYLETYASGDENSENSDDDNLAVMRSSDSSER